MCHRLHLRDHLQLHSIPNRPSITSRGAASLPDRKFLVVVRSGASLHSRLAMVNLGVGWRKLPITSAHTPSTYYLLVGALGSRR